MSIEFNNQDSRLGYLNEKLDDLLEGINSSYGEELFNELVLMEGSDSISTTQNSQDNTTEESNLDSEIMSEWEKRLEGLK